MLQIKQKSMMHPEFKTIQFETPKQNTYDVLFLSMTKHGGCGM